MRTLIPFACAAWLIALCPASASAQDRRFLEFPNNDSTTTFDLSTVQMIQPGRFSVISTTIDNPDVMEFELKVFGTLQTYCSRPAGKYPFPSDILTLGPADMPIKRVEVLGGPTRKIVLWYYPYKRLGYGTGEERSTSLICRMESIPDQRAKITNGHQTKELFDCRRGLRGSFFPGDDDPSKVITYVVKRDTVGLDRYARVCAAVMHEMPYLPERSGEKQPAAPSVPK